MTFVPKKMIEYHVVLKAGTGDSKIEFLIKIRLYQYSSLSLLCQKR